MAKKRKRQQVSEAESKAVLMTLFKDWIVNPLDNDFGFDFEVRLTSPMDDETQEVSEISFYVQNKSTIKSQKGKAIEDLDVVDWVLYLGQKIPVLIVKYDIPNKVFYWEIAQEYLWDVIEKEDPNWRRKRTKRIVLTKQIDNLDKIKTEICISQKRITRHHSLNLSIGEGMKIDEEDLSKLDKMRSKFLDEYKALTLKESYLLGKKGDKKKYIESLMEVYNSPKKDEAKIRAIIGIIFELNVAKLEENERIVVLANEAIELSEKLGIQYLKDYVTILRSQAILFTIIKKMSEVQIGLKIQDAQGERSFSFFYNQELVGLNDIHKQVIDEINDSLAGLLNRDIYYYLAALPILVNLLAVQINNFAVFNREIIDQEKEGRKILIEQCEFALSKISQIDLRKMLFRSLANYYYWVKEHERAVKYMTTAIELGKEDRDIPFTETCTRLLEHMKNKPDPYEHPETKPIDEMPVEEYQEMTKQILEAQGIRLDDDDYMTNMISMALRDMNPTEYFRHCENLHIGFVNTSPVGASIGLPTMGAKYVWCRYGEGSLAGIDLAGVFDSFRDDNCKSCKYHKRRSKKWVCYVEWVKDQADEPDFKKATDNLKKNW
ncbi:DUF4365 domain-containing protein [Candidatus Poribacteria bacterium]